MFSQNVRDGEQNLLSVINLIFSAHNGRGVGLPYCFQYNLYFLFLTFGVANYTRSGWPWVANYTLVFIPPVNRTKNKTLTLHPQQRKSRIP